MTNDQATETVTATLSQPHASVQGAMQSRQSTAQARPRASLMMVGLAALALAVVFVSTHMFPVPGGKIAVTSEITHGHLFDQRPSFSAKEVLARVDGFGEAGRAAYQFMTYTTDLVFPLAILVLLLLVTRHLLLIGRPAILTSVGGYLAVGFFVSDMIENTMIHHLLGVFPQTSVAASLLGVVTVAKFTFLGSAVLVLVVSAALRRPTSR